MLIPGVSGGTMAIILGIYDELIGAVSNMRRAFRLNTILLLTYAAGGGIGMLLLSGSLRRLVNWAPIPSMYFFMGAIVAGILPLYARVRQPAPSSRPDIVFEGAVIRRYSGKTRLRPINIVVAILGAGVGIGLKYLPEGLIPSPDELNFIALVVLFFAGIIIAIALILPGISGSYMLLVFGGQTITAMSLIKQFRHDQHLLFSHMVIILQKFSFCSAALYFPAVTSQIK
jgi:putative membrane protein